MTDLPQPEEKQYRIAIRRPVTMAMLFLTLVVFGWRSYQQLPINLMPDITYPTLTVRSEYEGAAPEDVEKLVTRPLEEMLAIVSGLVEISSISSAGRSEIILEFAWGTDMNIAQQDVRDRLDLFDPPREVTEKPVILRYDPTLDPVLRVAINAAGDYSDLPAHEQVVAENRALTGIRDAAERHLKADLEAESGIAQVAVKGGQEEEIQVLMDSQRLKGLGLTLQHVVDALAQQNINLSGGRLQEGKTEYLVRTLNEFTTVEEIGESIIRTPEGQQIRLMEVANVFMGTREREAIVRINGREAVGLDIFKEGDANTVQVANRVKDLLGIPRDRGAVERFQQRALEAVRMRGAGDGEEAEEQAALIAQRRTLLNRLPSDITLTLISDQSRFIVGSIREVQTATINGGLLALLVLFLFLREAKSTLIIGFSIPISVIATFVPMYARDISLNIMSLGGIALGVGMLVDNSIVVLESIFRCKEEGDNVLDAAERGTKEVGGAVIASTFTTISVFFPIAFVEGIAGQLFQDLALTVTFSLLASLLVALFLIPLLASRQRVALKADRDVVWMLQAYREGVAEKGSAGMSLLTMLPRGLGYGAAYVRDSAKDTFGPSLNALRRAGNDPAFRNLVPAFFGLIFLPLLVPVYFCQLVLKLVATLLITLLFLVSLVFLLFAVVVRLIFTTVLWGPLVLFERAFNGFRAVYGLVLEHTLRFAPLFLLVIVGISAHALMTARDLGTELIPAVNQGEFGIRMEARAGTRLQETEERAKRIEQILEELQEQGIVDTVTVEIGQEDSRGTTDRGENIAEFTVLLQNPEENARRQDAIIDQLREAIQRVSTEDINFTLPSLFTFKTAVELQIAGDDLAELRNVGNRALARVREVPGVEDAELSIKPGYPEVIVELDRELLASRNLSPGMVAQRLRTEVQGDIPTRFNRAGDKVDIRVRTDQAFLSSVEDLRGLSVSDGDPPIPLRDVASIRIQEGPSEIRRIDQRQVALITANVTGRDLGAVSREIMAAVADVERPRDFMFLPGGQFRELESSYQSLMFALLLAVFLVYVVMACQFESVIHPALVMFSVPLAFVGVIYALYFTGTNLSVMVFLGGIILAGIVVNNAIVLVDYINQLRARGLTKREAIVEAGKVRLRPIFMTTITTVLGLLPMTLGTGDGAEMRRPMALTVIAGLSSATILTLFIIPAVYEIFGGRDKDPVTTEDPPDALPTAQAP